MYTSTSVGRAICQRVFPLVATFLLAAMMCAIPYRVASAQTINANGTNVTEATFGQQGRALGRYRQTGSRQWQEIAANGSGFSFQEVGRDEWSVYLEDASRGVRIQLDLYRKLVLYGDGRSGEMSPLYDILGASAEPVSFARTPSGTPSAVVRQPAPVPTINANGTNVTEATFGQQGRALGRYRQTGARQWQEIAANGDGFSFEEVGRDEWSVYLDDVSRGVKIQLDLYRKLVLYGDGRSGEMSPLYDILGASAAPMTLSARQTTATHRQPGRVTSPGSELLATGNNSRSQKEFCWKDSYGRGVGTVPQSCGPGRERIGLLCYSQCPRNSQRFGFDCHTVCPSGMSPQGLFCRAQEYGRGTGYPIHFGEFDGDGMRARCEADHGKGKCEINGLIFYPKCKPGYSAFGCCICRPAVPNCAALGMNPGIDLSCAKKVTIGDPAPGTCAAGEEMDAGLCYRKCDAGYTGVGPVCWAGPPANWVECGMGAAKDSLTCGQIVFGQVTSVGQLAFNVASLGSGTAATGAASTASKAARFQELNRMYQQLKALYKKNEQAIEAVMLAKQAAGAEVSAIELLDDSVVTEEDIVRISAQIAAIADPTGVADTVAAYTYPKCSKYGF